MIWRGLLRTLGKFASLVRWSCVLLCVFENRKWPASTVTSVVLMKNPANYTEDFSFHVRFDAVEELRSYYVFVAATVSADTARLHLVAGSSLQSGRSGRWPLPPPQSGIDCAGYEQACA